MTLSFHEEMVRLLKEGLRAVVATLVRSRGSTPRRFGAKMIVTESAETFFTIGGGAFEALVIQDALDVLRTGRGLVKEYRFTEQGENATGMVCGGSARVLFELVAPPPALFVFGAGHVGRELVSIGVRLGFDVTVVDDRPRYLTSTWLTAGARPLRVPHDFADALPELPGGAFVAVLTRCHRTDLEVIRHVCADRRAVYVGVIGSRRKIATLKARATALGTPRDVLDRVHGPIGVKIGAQTPEEIAVSIAAEMIAVKNLGAVLEAETPGATVTPIDQARARRLRTEGSLSTPPDRDRLPEH